jgi:pimeloyl-ACP methyl ester carboxylesterase
VPDLQRPELRYTPDYLPPMAALRLLRMDPVADVRRVTLANAGHALMAENPDGVRSALHGFAQRVFAGGAA